MDNQKGMFDWLKEALPENQFNKEYLRDNRKMLVDRYVAQYRRFS